MRKYIDDKFKRLTGDFGYIPEVNENSRLGLIIKNSKKMPDTFYEFKFTKLPFKFIKQELTSVYEEGQTPEQGDKGFNCILFARHYYDNQKLVKDENGNYEIKPGKGKPTLLDAVRNIVDDFGGEIINAKHNFENNKETIEVKALKASSYLYSPEIIFN